MDGLGALTNALDSQYQGRVEGMKARCVVALAEKYQYFIMRRNTLLTGRYSLVDNEVLGITESSAAERV